MVRFFSRDKPKIKIEASKRDSFNGWLKCTKCNELIHTNELAQNLHCCPKCDNHYRISAKERIELLADRGSFEELFQEIQPTDPLHFVDNKPYKERLKENREEKGRDEAILCGRAKLSAKPIALAALDFDFMGGSMGSVVGERITRLIEWATEERRPVVIVSTSGGARMQESILSLMQMAKTAAALAKLHEAKVPYLSVLTNPTTGGVTASFASLGDVIIAEPDALICFAGPRVIEQTIGHQLPEGAQRSEFLLNHGMIDCIVKRRELKNRLAELIDFLSPSVELKCDG